MIDEDDLPTVETVAEWLRSFPYVPTEITITGAGEDIEEPGILWEIEAVFGDGRMLFMARKIPPQHMLVMGVALTTSEFFRRDFRRLGFLDQFAFEMDMHMSMSRHQVQHETEFPLNEDDPDDFIIEPPTVALVKSYLLLDDGLTRRELYHHVHRLMCAMTELEYRMRSL